MLYRCLDYLANRMNQSIRNTFKTVEDVVIVSSPIGADGQPPSMTQNRVLLFMNHIERDSFPQPQSNYSGSSRILITNKPLYINLSIVVAAAFNGPNYTDGLKLLSHLLAFCHRNSLFNRQNSPDMPPMLQQIGLELENLSIEQVGHIWGMLGSRYLPSAVYKVRTVIPNSLAVLDEAGELTTPELTLNRQS